VLTYLAAIAVFFVMMATMIVVERIYRRFAANHPERGPYRKQGEGCGSCKSCDDPTCKSDSDRKR
jgi:hypothetical protein